MYQVTLESKSSQPSRLWLNKAEKEDWMQQARTSFVISYLESR